MKHLFHLLVAAVFGAAVILVVAIGFARHDRDLLAPLDLFLLLAALLVYLLPTGLALYRDCKAGIWITAVDVLLGWTIFGWFIALGWAAAGKTKPALTIMSLPHPPAVPH
ncbi:MAG TPA: superinfection immunity protein [Terracidiphilus sp.]|nr:superinfection immunity protein [Terracidiphilus sp.]